jgi:hypothetical protein
VILKMPCRMPNPDDVKGVLAIGLFEQRNEDMNNALIGEEMGLDSKNEGFSCH